MKPYIFPVKALTRNKTLDVYLWHLFFFVFCFFIYHSWKCDYRKTHVYIKLMSWVTWITLKILWCIIFSVECIITDLNFLKNIYQKHVRINYLLNVWHFKYTRYIIFLGLLWIGCSISDILYVTYTKIDWVLNIRIKTVFLSKTLCFKIVRTCALVYIPS